MPMGENVSGCESAAGGKPYPLKGVRVLDFTQIYAGSNCTQLLGDMGAEIIKVEEPRFGDLLRTNTSKSAFVCLNRSKRSVGVDLRSAEGREIIYRLARRSDIAAQNFRPGVVERLKIDYASLCHHNPAIIYASVSGFGLTGPYSHRPALDPMAQALSGLMSITGEGDRPPAVVGCSMADYSASLCLTVGILAALHYRAQTGKGQHVDTSLLDAMAAGLGGKEQIIFQDGQRVPRLGSAHALHVPYQAFLAADGRYVYVAVYNDNFWQSFCAAFDLHELLADPRYAHAVERSRNRDALIPQVAEILGRMKSEDIIAALDKAEVPCAPVLELDEAIDDPQIVHNGMRLAMDHPAAGRVKMWGCPIHFSETPARPQRVAPLLGQHTDEVLPEIGYSADDIASLRERNIIR